MQEIEIDIAHHRSKHLEEFSRPAWRRSSPVCGHADQACSLFPGQLNRHHWGFDDPAHAPGSEEQQMAVFRRVRDEIRRVCEAYAAGRKDAAPHQSSAPETTWLKRTLSSTRWNYLSELPDATQRSPPERLSG